MQRESASRLIVVVGSALAVILGAQPVTDLVERNQSSVALAHYAYANKCSPLSLLRCLPPRPDAESEARVELAALNNPNDPSVQRDRGFYLILQGSYGPADQSLRQVVGQSPADATAAFGLSTVDLREGRADEAVAIWRQLRATPLVAGFADVAMQGHDYAGAQSLYQLAVEANPADPILKAHLAEADHALATPKVPPAPAKPASH